MTTTNLTHSYYLGTTGTSATAISTGTVVVKGGGGGVGGGSGAGKTWRSLDLTQHNSHQSPNFLMTTTTAQQNLGHSPHSSNSNLHSPQSSSGNSSSLVSSSSTGLLTINCNVSASTSPHQMLTPNTISNLTQIGGSVHTSSGYYYQQQQQAQQLQQQQQSPRSEFKNRRSSSEPVQDLLAGSQQKEQQSQEDNRNAQVHLQHHAIECIGAALKVRQRKMWEEEEMDMMINRCCLSFGATPFRLTMRYFTTTLSLPLLMMRLMR